MSASVPTGARVRHELIPLSEPERWRAAVSDVPHGHAHTHGFCRAVQLTSGLPTFLYRYENGIGRVVCALSERRFRGHTDIVTPYGFGGFATERIPAGFPRHWTDFARSRRWVCGYHALDPSLCEPASFPDDEVHVHNQLYVMDLRGSIQDVWRRLSRNRRRQLRDWPAVAETLIRDRARLTEFLLDNYRDFFGRRGAGPATAFVRETISVIAELEDVFMVGAGHDGHVTAVAVFGHTPHGGDALFNISAPGSEHHAVHFVWFAVERLRAMGISRLNLGGGIRLGDDVAEFKRRFGADQRPLWSLRQIYRAGVYQKLCRESARSPANRSGYFPAYRAPH